MIRLFRQINRSSVWISLIIISFSFVIHFKDNRNLDHVIFSDGEGYYAYLPAYFIQQDPTYQSTMKMEESYVGHPMNFFYVTEYKKGKYINKYFPGVALMQLPGFAFTSLALYVAGKPVTGYSRAYLLAFYLTSLIFAILGFWLFVRNIKIYIEKNKIQLPDKIIYCLAGAIFFGTAIFYSLLAYPSFSHVYSFFLINALFFYFQQYQTEQKKTFLLYCGILLGLIFLVRPTNLIVVLFLLFFFDSFQSFWIFLKDLFNWKSVLFLYVIVPFLLLCSVLLLVLKWQTGSFFAWSYRGESFNFNQLRLLQSWFSYRIGIFLHHPVLLICVPGIFILYKSNLYKSIVWIIYFLISSYLISSWWCWDYESVFGHRGFSEHFLIFIFPLLYLYQFTRKKSVIWFLVGITLLYSLMRFYQKVENIFPNQKFTAKTYWKSMFDIDNSIIEKYTNRSHCIPFGKLENVYEVTSKERNITYNSTREYGLNATFHFPQDRLNNRFFIEATFRKKIKKEEDWRDIIFVTDSYSKIDLSRYYFTQPIYNYYKEGNGEWVETSCQEEIPLVFGQKDSVNIYIWNKALKHFEIKDYKLKVYEYSSAKR